MKQLKTCKESFKTIDSKKEHYQTLFKLGILDDEEDWELYQKQEDKYSKVLYNMSVKKYFSYVNEPKNKI